MELTQQKMMATLYHLDGAMCMPLRCEYVQWGQGRLQRSMKPEQKVTRFNQCKNLSGSHVAIVVEAGRLLKNSR